MSNEMTEIELSIEEAQLLVDRKNQVDKLFSNREFKKAIVEGYFEKEAARLVALSGNSNAAQHRPEIFLEIQAISKLREYLQAVVAMGRAAERDLAELREAREELNGEAA